MIAISLSHRALLFRQEAVQRYRQQRNYPVGWAKQSNLQEKVYCPENAKYMAGPLYWDREATNGEFEHFFAKQHFEKFSALLCAYCGLPSCGCGGCVQAMLEAQQGGRCKPTVVGDQANQDNSQSMILLNEGPRKKSSSCSRGKRLG